MKTIERVDVVCGLLQIMGTLSIWTVVILYLLHDNFLNYLIPLNIIIFLGGLAAIVKYFIPNQQTGLLRKFAALSGMGILIFQFSGLFFPATGWIWQYFAR